MAGLEIKVTAVRDAPEAEGGRYSEFLVECWERGAGEPKASNWRRFRQFRALSKQLKLAGLPELRLPPATNLLGGRVNLERRKDGLNRAMQEHVQSQGRVSSCILAWLDVDISHNGKAQDAALREAVSLLHADVVAACAEASMRSRLLASAVSLLVLSLGMASVVERQAVLGTSGAVTDFGRNISLHSPSGNYALLVLGIGLGLAVGVLAMDRVASARQAVSANTVPGKSRTRDEILFDITATLSTKLGTNDKNNSESDFPPVLNRTKSVKSDCSTNVPETSSLSFITNSRSLVKSFEDAPTLPQHFLDDAEKALLIFNSHMKDDVNHFGEPWEAKLSKADVQVWSSAEPGEKRRVWKSFVQCYAPRVEDVVQAWSDWPSRLAWDTTFAQGSTLMSYDGGETLASFVSAAQMGVSSREYLEVAKTFRNDNGVFVMSVSATEDLIQQGDKPSSKKGSSFVKATTKLGSGALMRAAATSEGLKNGKILVDVFLIAHTDLNGWIPQNVINTAMPKALADTAMNLRGYLEKTYP
eukprot:TRINITY_DN50516_c0_g1_i1.p1 TRINITY_DN50516_c0_g1~~TRINITY_DN50516_c0_g1_i1.p1  ORF type:complete len:530 (-),score=81.25 TRINITY_DN50516_c0_g1_i1:44-1633(-)